MLPNFVLAFCLVTQAPVFPESMVLNVYGNVSNVVSSLIASAVIQAGNEDRNTKSDWKGECSFIRDKNRKVVGYFGVDAVPGRLLR